MTLSYPPAGARCVNDGESWGVGLCAEEDGHPREVGGGGSRLLWQRNGASCRSMVKSRCHAASCAGNFQYEAASMKRRSPRMIPIARRRRTGLVGVVIGPYIWVIIR